MIGSAALLLLIGYLTVAALVWLVTRALVKSSASGRRAAPVIAALWGPLLMLGLAVLVIGSFDPIPGDDEDDFQ